ncbi:MAG: hypothetical protein NVS1B7_6070 [Candidatus Saccharimonadales bacterium]
MKVLEEETEELEDSSLAVELFSTIISTDDDPLGETIFCWIRPLAGTGISSPLTMTLVDGVFALSVDEPTLTFNDCVFILESLPTNLSLPGFVLLPSKGVIECSELF